MRCSCIRATARNKPSVRKGFEMGGYILKTCDVCKARKAADQLKAISNIELYESEIQSICDKANIHQGHYATRVRELGSKYEEVCEKLNGSIKSDLIRGIDEPNHQQGLICPHCTSTLYTKHDGYSINFATGTAYAVVDCLVCYKRFDATVSFNITAVNLKED